MNHRRFSISISDQDWQKLKKGLFTSDRKENAAALLCGISDFNGERRLLVRRVVPVPDDLYIQKLEYHLEVSPRFYNSIVSECLRIGGQPVIVHSHPMNTDARYSPSDDFGELRLLPVLESLIPESTPASLLVAFKDLIGRRLIEREFHNIDAFRIVGSRTRIITSARKNQTESMTSQRYERQIRAFGVEGQQQLQTLRVAIVGVGGTGSLVAEQMVRAGITNFLVIDNDRIEESNVNRLFGSTMSDVGAYKTTVIASALRGLGAEASEIQESAIKQSVLMQLRDRDLIFSCVDNDRSRAILSRFAYQYLIPVIDVGVRLDGRAGHVKAAAGRVSVVGAGLSCLRCSHHLSPERIRAESLPESEREKLEKEGYIMGITEPAPAVVSLNAVVASLAATAGLNMFVNLTGGLQPLDQLYDATTGTVFITNPQHESECDICDPDIGVKGLGDKQIVSAY